MTEHEFLICAYYDSEIQKAKKAVSVAGEKYYRFIRSGTIARYERARMIYRDCLNNLNRLEIDYAKIKEILRE